MNLHFATLKKSVLLIESNPFPNKFVGGGKESDEAMCGL